MADTSPIVKAQKLLAEAERKLGEAEQLRVLAPRLSSCESVRIDTSAMNLAFGCATRPNEKLLRDAMIAGCNVHSDRLKREAEAAAIEAGKLLAPPPVMRGGIDQT